MKRIDFLGAPGVGKSTLYNHLIANRRKGTFWITPTEAELKIAREHIKKLSTKNKKVFLARLALNNIFFKPLHPTIVDKVINLVENEIIWDNKIKYTEFLNQAVLGACLEEKDSLRRLMGINYFFKVMKTVVLFENSKYDEIVILDESLSQKVCGLTHYKESYFEKQTKEYFSCIPVPDLLIHCKLDIKTTLQRLITRYKTIPAHRNITKAELLEVVKIHNKIANIGAKILKQRNVLVLDIDMKQCPEKNIQIINSFGGNR